MRPLEEINWDNNRRQTDWEARREKAYQEWDKQFPKTRAIPGVPITSELLTVPESKLQLTEEDKDFLKSIGVTE